jgi:hypothetical protein
MANLCALKTENTSQNHPNVKACAKFSWSEDFAQISHSEGMVVLVAFRLRKKSA